MPRVSRDALEKPMQLRQAERILDEFFNDSEAYPEDDVLMRTGICKDLAEEFHPLVRLAQSFKGVRNLHLLPLSNRGADAIIGFWWRHAAKVQITCAHEGYNRAMEREYLRDKGNALVHQNWERNNKNGDIVPKGTGYFELSEDIQLRVNRILKAIADKENKYYPETEILLIHEDPANYQYLKRSHLHEQVQEKVLIMGSHYQHIYVNYGDRLRQIK
jgi:hypothetical protein